MTEEMNRQEEPNATATPNATEDTTTANAETLETTAKAEETEATLEAEKTDAQRLSEAEAKIKELSDKLLYQRAEFENFRKRTIKEKTDLILGGGQRVLEAILPVLDDLERAQQNIENSTDVETLKEGVNLIIDKLQKTLSAQGLKRIETADAPFDTDFHEAIAIVPAGEGAPKNVIIDCVQAGYMLNEKVIRHAKVVVSQ